MSKKTLEQQAYEFYMRTHSAVFDADIEDVALRFAADFARDVAIPEAVSQERAIIAGELRKEASGHRVVAESSGTNTTHLMQLFVAERLEILAHSLRAEPVEDLSKPKGGRG